MANGGFFEQKSASPTRFALVAAGHAGVLAAVMMAAGPQIIRHWDPPIKVTPIPIPQTPPPDPVRQPEAERQLPIPPRPMAPDPEVPTSPRPDPGPLTGGNPSGPTGGGTISDPAPPADPPAPVRRGAEVDPRFAHLLQPQYPAAEQRAQRGGTVVLRVTIGTDGRVRAAERVSATSDAFWAAAERQALTRWRFRPATIDGRPVESSRTMTVHFRIEDV